MSPLKRPNIACDKRVLLIVVFLLAIGASLVASSSSYFAALKYQDPYLLLKQHLVRIMIGVLVLWFALHFDYRFYRKTAPVIFVGAICLLAALFVFGTVIRDSNRWLYIRFLQVTIQPSELARLAMVLFLAYWFARKGKEIEQFKRGFLPAAGAVLIPVCLMVAQPNFGTASATAAIGFLMLYLGRAKILHITALAASVVSVAAVRVMSTGYVQNRLGAFFERGEDLHGMNWQSHQSLIGLGSGGLFGIGFGESRQKLNWLPDSHTDFIFSILGEEAGLVGTMLVSLLFLLVALRALKLSKRCPDIFGEMVVLGVGCSIFVYAVFNMCVSTGLLPVTGLPLPFLSYGGSALVVNSLSIGILLNVSKRRSPKTANRRKTRARPRERGTLCAS